MRYVILLLASLSVVGCASRQEIEMLPVGRPVHIGSEMQKEQKDFEEWFRKRTNLIKELREQLHEQQKDKTHYPNWDCPRPTYADNSPVVGGSSGGNSARQGETEKAPATLPAEWPVPIEPIPPPPLPPEDLV